MITRINNITFSKPQRCVIIYGAPTTGKTTFAKHLFDTGYIVLDTDTIVDVLHQYLAGSKQYEPFNGWAISKKLKSDNIAKFQKRVQLIELMVAKFLSTLDSYTLLDPIILTNFHTNIISDVGFKRSNEDLINLFIKRRESKGSVVDPIELEEMKGWTFPDSAISLTTDKFITTNAIKTLLGDKWFKRTKSVSDEQLDITLLAFRSELAHCIEQFGDNNDEILTLRTMLSDAVLFDLSQLRNNGERN